MFQRDGVFFRETGHATEGPGMFQKDGACFGEIGHVLEKQGMYRECFVNTKNISYGATFATLKSLQLVMILIILYGHLHHLYP